MPVSPPGEVSAVTAKAATLSAPSTSVTRPARATTRPPYGEVGRRTDLLPSATHSGHWKPTEACRMQSGQIGRLAPRGSEM